MQKAETLHRNKALTFPWFHGLKVTFLFFSERVLNFSFRGAQ